jgi:hypothetical protein
MHGEMRNSQLIRRPQGEETTIKTRRINDKINPSGTGCDRVNWVQSQGSLMGSCEEDTDLSFLHVIS